MHLRTLRGKSRCSGPNSSGTSRSAFGGFSPTTIPRAAWHQQWLVSTCAALTPGTWRGVRSHRWSDLLVEGEERELRLVCEPLANMALRIERQRGRESQDIGLSLAAQHYRQGHYSACIEGLREATAPPLGRLRAAATMMKEVFGDNPQSPYFRADIRWKTVRELARDAAQDEEPDSAGEFRGWEKIAHVHAGLPRSDRRAMSDYLETLENNLVPGAEKAVILLGIRLLGVERDPSPVTAAHMAIPLVEDILRHYVRLVLQLSVSGEAYSRVSDRDLSTWWPRPDNFQRPSGKEPLSVPELALLAAVVSSRRGKPLFDDPRDLQRLVTTVDQVRNLVGHHVTNPEEKARSSLSRLSRELILKMCSHSQCDMTLECLAELVRPPRRFLAGLPLET